MKITITSEEDRVLWLGQLKEAEQALHKLNIGQMVSSAGTPDDNVAFQVTRVRNLEQHIKNIRFALGLSKSTRSTPPSRGVVYV